MVQLREVGIRLRSPLPVLGNLGSKFGAQGVRREVWCRSQSPSSQSNRGAALPGGSNILRRLLGENIGGDGTTSDISSTTTITTTTQKVNDLIFEEMDKVVGSLLFCPICSPQRSAEDSDYLYYPADEDIPVTLCKHLYGYPRDFEERYESLEEVGKGSFGVVHRVVDKQTGEFFAVKTLPKSRPTWTGGMDGGMRDATTSAYLLKIQAEVNFLARLSDVEQVVRLVKAYEDNSHVHLVMDLCTGGSLYDKMEEIEDDEEHRDYFTEERVRIIMQCVISMLVQCHGRGIIYRDLKPQNFLYVDDSPSSAIKCSDYGLAMSYIPSDPEGLALNKRAGTPVYMAPEVVLRRYDEKADLWSAGMLMYQLLSNKLPLWNGQVPFSANLDEIFFDTLIRDIDFDCIAEYASPEAADLCKNLLSRDPDKRLSATQAAKHPWLRL